MSETRRHFLAGLAASPLSFATQNSAPDDGIAKLEIVKFPVNRRGEWVVARITTSKGVTGLGDASHGRSDDEVAALMKSYFERMKAGSPWQIDRYKQNLLPEVMQGGRDAAVASSALEQCLWDICGKLVEQPVYRLLGGKLRDKIRTYANINRATMSRQPEEFARHAKAAAEAGFEMIKMASFDGMPRKGTPDAIAAHTDLGIRCIDAVREAVGPKVEILVDGHSNFDLQRGLEVVERLEPLRLSWIEELVPGAATLAQINRATEVPTAGGESLFGVKTFQDYLAAGAVDIAMPDVKYCGGVLELKKIAAVAESMGLSVSPHGPASPVGHAVGTHLCATIPNFHSLEYAFGENPNRETMVNPVEKLDGGYTKVSDRAGWGVELARQG